MAQPSHQPALRGVGHSIGSAVPGTCRNVMIKSSGQGRHSLQKAVFALHNELRGRKAGSPPLEWLPELHSTLF